MSNSAELEVTADGPKVGHPKGLYVLFSAEMWERFSYYGMRALLVLYLTSKLGYKREEALGLYATYTGLVYLTPLLGGPLADRFLGQRKAILIGGLLMALGHFAMAFEEHLYMALGLIILGNGFFKPNISTMVGQLYEPGDSRRDSAYTIFYMGINLGASISPLVCGFLAKQQGLGEHYGFGAAGVGMLLALLTFIFMQRVLGNQGYPPGRGEGPHRFFPIDIVHVIVLTVLGVGLVFVALKPAAQIAQAGGRSGSLLVLSYWILLALVYVGFTFLLCTFTESNLKVQHPTGSLDAKRDAGTLAEDDPTSLPFTGVDWQRLAVIFFVSMFSIVFWMAFEQAGGTLTLFAEEKTNRFVFGYEFPASWYQSVNPFLIIAMAPIMSQLWGKLDRTKYALNSAAKMGLGLIVLGLGVTIMATAESQAAKFGKVGPLWLVCVYLLYTLGELCLSPIGLSLVNKLAHPKVASLMMGGWFVCTAVANFLAGKLEELLKETHINMWTFLIFTSIGPGVVLLLLSPLLKKMGHGRL
ncbi:peptide MFS transporter [Singulisphaera sp. PoT]|uniref:peptide MFS transporter n=1 Tax=Singulisphaera sp. PoT TaxID=3411797 RepID=UPI003BF48CFF